MHFAWKRCILTLDNGICEPHVFDSGRFLLLILNPKRVFTYEMLMDLVWEEDYTYYSRKAVNNHVSNLRRKLKIAPDLPNYIKSVYGIGYKFEEK